MHKHLFFIHSSSRREKKNLLMVCSAKMRSISNRRNKIMLWQPQNLRGSKDKGLFRVQFPSPLPVFCSASSPPSLWELDWQCNHCLEHYRQPRWREKKRSLSITGSYSFCPEVTHVTSSHISGQSHMTKLQFNGAKECKPTKCSKCEKEPNVNNPKHGSKGRNQIKGGYRSKKQFTELL